MIFIVQSVRSRVRLRLVVLHGGSYGALLLCGPSALNTHLPLHPTPPLPYTYSCEDPFATAGSRKPSVWPEGEVGIDWRLGTRQHGMLQASTLHPPTPPSLSIHHHHDRQSSPFLKATTFSWALMHALAAAAPHAAYPRPSLPPYSTRHFAPGDFFQHNVPSSAAMGDTTNGHFLQTNST